MKPEWKAKWLAALRGGSFNHGTNVLCKTLPNDTTKHCCLGVLAELLLAEGLVREKQIAKYMRDSTGISYSEYDGVVTYLSISMSDAVGLTRSQVLDLAEINDNADSYDAVITEIEKL